MDEPRRQNRVEQTLADQGAVWHQLVIRPAVHGFPDAGHERAEGPAQPGIVLGASQNAERVVGPYELGGVGGHQRRVRREAPPAGAHGQVGRVVQVHDRRQVHVYAHVHELGGDEGRGLSGEGEVVALAQFRGRRDGAKAVLLLEAMVKTALIVDGDQDRDLIRGLEHADQLAQLVARPDVASPSRLGVHVVDDDRPDGPRGDIANRRLGLERGHAAEADHDHLPDPVA